jgi:ABC-2 type transport system ATP-binding protein
MLRVDGKIKLLRLEQEEHLITLQKQAVVISTNYESTGLVARILDENSSFPSIAAVPATLEDAYVYCMGGKTHA